MKTAIFIAITLFVTLQCITADPLGADPTTTKPTTAAPTTTAKPTTAAPMTAKPTTAAPTTTAKPTTAAPTTTAKPVTAAPTTKTPTAVPTAMPSTPAPTTTKAPKTTPVPTPPPTPTPATVTMYNCTTNSGGTTTTFPAGSCRSDGQYGFKVDCPSIGTQCAKLVRYSDSYCNNYQNIISIQCNSCFKGELGWGYAKCDMSTQSVSVQLNCTSDCKKCTGGTTYHPYAVCSAGIMDGSIMGLGVEQCDVATLTNYGNSKCDGEPTTTISVVQGVCNFHVQVTCSNEQGFTNAPVTPKTQVLTSFCTGGGCTGQCSYQTVKSGDCQTFQQGLGSHRTTCLGTSGYCASLAFFNKRSDGTCPDSNFLSIDSGVCGTCSQSGYGKSAKLGYYKTICDFKTQLVSYNLDCDSTCTTCGSNNVYQRPLHQCVDVPNSTYSVVNFGIQPCNIVNRQEFRDDKCSQISMYLNYTTANGACNGGNRIVCGENFDLPNPVEVSQCFCGNNCSKATVLTEQCVDTKNIFPPLPSGHENHGHAPPAQFRYAKASCGTTTGTCASVLMFNDTTCTKPMMAYTLVCDTCNDFNGNFMRTTCDTTTNSISIFQCDSTCKKCASTPIAVNPFDSCSPSAHIPGGPVYHVINRGLSACDTVVKSFYNTSDCRGDPSAQVTAAQGICSAGIILSCATKPPLPTLPPSQMKSVTVSTCLGGGCYGQCTYNTFDSGTCQDIPGTSDSATLSCQSDVYQCADLVVFKDGNCAEFDRLYTPVCNTCNKWPEHFSHGYTRVDCQPSGDVYLSINCDSNCQNCEKTLPRPFEQCAPGIHGTHSVMSHGIHPCNAVLEKRYTGSGCKGTPTVQGMAALGNCEGGTSFFCGIKPPVQLPTVTETLCRCPSCTAAQYVPQMYNAGVCTDIPVYNLSTMTTCSTKPATCARVGIFNDSSCSSYIDMGSVICGQCWKSITEYVKIDCDPSGQTVTATHGCDATCQNCKSTTTTVTYFEQCGKGYPSPIHYFNYGVGPCDSVTVKRYPLNSGCKGTPLVIAELTQSECTFGDRFVCSNQPALPAPVKGKKILITQCSHDMCQTGCKETVVQDKTCKSTGSSSSMRATCVDSATCVSLVYFNSTSTQCTRGTFVSVYSPVCGGCMRHHASKEFVKINCNMLTQDVTIDAGCDSKCASCSRPSAYTHTYDGCSATSMPTFSVFNGGIFPCQSVHFEMFEKSASCGGTADADTWIANGKCEAGTRIECGEGNPAIPTSPPTTHAPAHVDVYDCTTNGDGKIIHMTENVCNKGMTVQCPTAQATCFNVMRFSDNYCQNFSSIVAIQCNSCFKAGPDVGFTFAQCDMKTQAITLKMHCNSDCSSCDDTRGYPYATCNPDPFFGTALNQGIVPCDVATVKYYSTETCTGTPVSVTSVLQGACSSGIQVECSNAMPFTPAPVTPKTKVLVTRCDGIVCSGSCTYDVLPSGGCQKTQGMGSNKFTCQAKPAMCAGMAIYNSSQCNDNTFLDLYTAVCGSCSLYPFHHSHRSSGPNNYTQVVCNENQSVSFNMGCDSTCGNCSQTGIDPRPLHKCTNALMPGISAINFGLVPCSTILREVFTDDSCQDRMAAFPVASGMCEGHGRFECGTEFNLPTPVAISECWCGDHCHTSTVMAGSCVDTQAVFPPGQPHTHSNHSNHNHNNPAPFRYATASCLPTTGLCVPMLLFNDTTCTLPLNAFTAVCDACNSVYGKLMHVTCDPKTGSVKVYSCDGSCSNCSSVPSAVHPFDACTPTPPMGPNSNIFNVINQGLSECNIVTKNFYTSPTCTGSPSATFSAAQSECSDGVSLTCGGKPPLPTLPPGATKQVTVSQCTGGACYGDCTYNTIDTGKCVPLPGTRDSVKLECQTQVSQCSTVAVFNSPNCKDFQRLYHAVCNTCNKWSETGEGSTFVHCHPSGDVFVEIGCDDTCSTCTGRALRPVEQCSQGINNPTISVINHGLQPCNTIKQTRYRGPNCQGTPVAIGVGAEGYCEGGTSMFCGVKPPPQIPTVTETVCQCPNCTDQQLAPQMYNAGECTTLNAFSMNTITECRRAPAMCARVGVFNDTGCQTYLNFGVIVCGQCWESFRGRFIKVDCSPYNQTVTAVYECDSTCTNCQMSTRRVVPYEQCGAGYPDPIHIFNFGIAPCDAVTLTRFSDKKCASTIANFTVAQGVCSFNDRVVCSDMPPLPVPVRGKQVLVTHCSHHMCYEGCTETIATDTACKARPDGKSAFRASCQSSNMCAQLLMWKDSTCSTSFDTDFTPICGMCTRRNSTTPYMRVHCNYVTGDVTIDSGCDDSCTVCTQRDYLVHPYNRCSGALHPGRWILNQGLFPCQGIQYEVYNSVNCDPSTLMYNYTAADGECEFGTRIQCGAFNPGILPTRPPGPTGTPNPSGSPMPTGTVNPSWTPGPSGTAFPSGTPGPTGTANPSWTPRPTGTQPPATTTAQPSLVFTFVYAQGKLPSSSTFATNLRIAMGLTTVPAYAIVGGSDTVTQIRFIGPDAEANSDNLDSKLRYQYTSVRTQMQCLSAADSTPIIPLKSKSSDNKGAIIGGVIGGIVVVLIVIGIIGYLVTRPKQEADQVADDSNLLAEGMINRDTNDSRSPYQKV